MPAIILAKRRRLDFVVLCESKLRDATLVRALALGLSPSMHIRVLNCSRPDSFDINGELSHPSGGILVLVFNPSLTIIDSWDEKKGILSFSAKLPYAAPFACVCVYLPDVSSTFSRWTDGLIEASVNEIKRRRLVHGNLVFWLGDFNVRVGHDHFGRRISPDSAAPKSPRVKLMHRMMRALRMIPIHGRARHIPAYFTSSQITGGQGLAEVDFIMASTDLPTTMFRAIPAPAWDSAELPKGTHLPVFVEMTLPAADTISAPVRRTRRRRPFFLPPYCDPKWFQIHDLIHRELPRVLRDMNRPASSLEECHKSLTSLFRSAAIAICGTPMARVATFKHRLYKGAPLPTEIVALFELARHQRKCRKVAHGNRARAFWQRAADASKRTATLMAESFLIRYRDTMLLNLQHEMRIDPHQCHAFLAHLRGAEASNCADPSVIPTGPDGCPPLLRFARACKKLVTQVCAIPFAVYSPAWLVHIFRAPGGLELIRPFTAYELYPFLFPPTKRFRFKPCHHACRICRQYASELDRWKPRDPFPVMPVPHHRGSLHTSRGAALDLLVAELVRWVRPDDFSDTFQYRMAVCGLLALFFNRMLSSCTVPAGVFTSCVTSPLYKSVKRGAQPPPRWDDDAYRFITNSSLFAKAFSTVLASRLAHWAVRIGLVSSRLHSFRFVARRSMCLHFNNLRVSVRGSASKHIYFL